MTHKKRILALALGAGLLLAGQSTVLTTAAVASEAELGSLVAKKAAVLEKMHKKASKALVNSAQDNVFADFFHSEGHDRHGSKAKVEEVSLAVQSKFHVEEMCLIDVNGQELARIVGSEIAPDDDLSPDETGAIFFEPGLAQESKQVYLSPPYMSPDASKWVVAYTTPVVVDGTTKALLHYEHGLDVFQEALNKGVSGSAYLLAVSADGYVISDSRKALAVAIKGEKEDLADYFQTLAQSEGDELGQVFAGIGNNQKGTATFSRDGAKFAVAYARVNGGWTLMAVEPADASQS